jgi:DNA polymerase I
MNRPLLVIDGDSFTHRAFHALPKSVRLQGNRGGGAIVGFANLLLRLFETEEPRAVLCGWDALSSPNFRQRLFPAYQTGRQFDVELVDQLDLLPELVIACGFAHAKGAGYEADDFLAAAVAAEERRHGDRARRQWRPRCISTCLIRDDHSVSDQDWRIGPHWTR